MGAAELVLGRQGLEGTSDRVTWGCWSPCGGRRMERPRGGQGVRTGHECQKRAMYF